MPSTNQIEVAGTDLEFRAVPLDDQTPSGAQIARAAGFSADDFVYVLQLRANDELEDVRAVESVSLAEGCRFIVAQSDRSYRLAMDGNPLDWPSRFITAATLRKLSGVDPNKVIFLENTNEPDRLLAEDDLVDLDEPAVEKFRSGKDDRPREQNVHVKHLGELETATFKVAETATLQHIWDRAYIELEVAREPRDVFQAEVNMQPVSLMEHLELSLVEAQRRELCKRKFEIAARTGGA
ncbi:MULTISPECIES: multiubiquitin domain-containing protein [Sinorhizobium]|uniref:multiubiquitin domain-containing protein n=1 Tax=Sinorhizobium TaxID=28105 RepID=UPI0003FE2C5F|nr:MULTISPECIES: multiubiquitin domain-containing protein [Sinorhizobium]WOS66964.1 multiubiquitin domain-containing protein [Sinorhizobium fredii GR64]